MPATYKKIFNRLNRLKTDGTAPIHIRVIVDRKTYYINTGILILPDQWSDKNGGTIINHRKAAKLNKKLSEVYNALTDYEIECDEKDRPFYPQQAITEGNKDDFVAWMKKEVANDRTLSFGTYKNHMATINHCEQFGLFKTFADVHYNNVVKFDQYLRGENLGINTLYNKHSKLRRYINKAIKSGMIREEDNPYKKFDIPSQKFTTRKFLTKEMLDKLIATDMPSKRLERVKDMFLFSVYTGLSYADVFKLTNEDLYYDQGTNFIITDRTKTDEESAIAILPQAADIIYKYRDDERETLLPIIANQKMNVYLKEVQALCKIDINLTYHVARHTFATTVTLDNGVPIETVSRMLGHTDLRTTMVYARITRKKLANDMNDLADKLNPATDPNQ